MQKIIRIGTRESQLAIWQANEVKHHLERSGYTVELIPIKSEGDIDLKTPLYAMGVQGIFTRSLDIALLNNRIDIAVHSMKDVPVQLPEGISQAAVLERGPVHDLLVFRNEIEFLEDPQSIATIATSSIRRTAQWLRHYPNHTITNLRGNVNTRLKKLADSQWQGAIFARAGLERIGIRPDNSQILDWMLPAPAQGAIMLVCRTEDNFCLDACATFNDGHTELCTAVERAFLHTLMGGCSTPISALATIAQDILYFKGNICSLTGDQQLDIEMSAPIAEASEIGNLAARTILEKGGAAIIATMNHAKDQ